ncbi:hypothetical protein D3C81_1326980 [compost metagenome]
MWQPGLEVVCGHQHATGVDAQAFLAIVLQQAHQARAAQVDVLEQYRQVTDVQLHHEDAVDFTARQVGQRQHEGQSPTGHGAEWARRLDTGQEGFEAVSGNVQLQLAQPVFRQCRGVIGMAGRHPPTVPVIQAHAFEQRVFGKQPGQAGVALVQRFQVALGDAPHDLGAVDQLAQALRDDAGQVQVFGGLGGQRILARGGLLREVQPPEKGQGGCTEHQDQQAQKAGGRERTANHS